MSNQDIEGNVPSGDAPGAAAGKPESVEQQLAREREARTLMRDRLRHTEALAAESHALRARMAQELERVTADRDRLRTAASTASGPDAAPKPATSEAAPPMTPRATDWPLKPPSPPPQRSGPWRALAMLGGLAAVVGAVAWYSSSTPGGGGAAVHPAREAAAPGSAAVVATAAPAARVAPPATAPTAAFPLPNGAVALPPVAPDAQLAAAPPAAGPPTATGGAETAPAGLAARLRKALDGEGIASPVDVDATSGHVLVADPQSNDALRDRTDMLIRAVYAGANLAEPQIEHRWLSPRRVDKPAPVAQAVPAPAATVSPATAYAARHAADDAADHAAEHRRKAAGATVADVEELRAVLPEGRVTAGCRASLAGKGPHRADMTACMKHSCCSATNRSAEDCRAYQSAYPFTCSAG